VSTELRDEQRQIVQLIVGTGLGGGVVDNGRVIRGTASMIRVAMCSSAFLRAFGRPQ
jgi:hypothetical protein